MLRLPQGFVLLSPQGLMAPPPLAGLVQQLQAAPLPSPCINRNRISLVATYKVIEILSEHSEQHVNLITLKCNR